MFVAFLLYFNKTKSASLSAQPAPIASRLAVAPYGGTLNMMLHLM